MLICLRKELVMDAGIIVAATHHIEWLLPWWWYNLRIHNDLPCAFFDLGMTDAAKNWCRQRGDLIPFNIPDISEKSTVDPSLAQKWEDAYGSGLWEIRPKWFKKPFVFLHSPFLNTLWLDLDCEVRAPLQSIFSHCRNEGGLAVVREAEAMQQFYQSSTLTLPGEITYNSGVIAYRRNSPILSLWIEEVRERNHLHVGDQDALSRILFAKKPPFLELPPEYNWSRGLGPNPEALIFHWHGPRGKLMIQEQIRSYTSLGFFPNLELNLPG